MAEIEGNKRYERLLWPRAERRIFFARINPSWGKLQRLPMMATYSQKDRETLIRTLWGEARGEDLTGKKAVAHVIANRARKKQWPNTIHEVCTQPWQFSCWNASDPNRGKLLAIAIESSDPAIRDCRLAAEAVLNGEADFTNGADHYYADYIKAPSWAIGQKLVYVVGRHRFFNLYPEKSSPKPNPIQPTDTTMIHYFLDFTMGLDTDGRLEEGRLVLRSISEQGGRTHQIWVCTTSTANKQKPEDFHQKGGPIPPEYRVPNLRAWEVETTPIAMPGTKGVEGNFYKILPYLVKTDKGGDRGDFGIHRDANVPGSMGCPVMSAERFKAFEAEMKRLKELGYTKIPLFVTYSTN
jgi:hypothetical protein